MENLTETKKVEVINYRVPVDFQGRIQRELMLKKLKISDLMLKVLTNYFEPPPPEIKEVEKIVEVERFVDREVIKEVVIDSEGTVMDGVRIQLSQLLSDELKKLNDNPEKSLDAFVADICWGRIKWSQNKKSPVTTQINGTSQSAVQTSSARVAYWRKRISETESWDEIAQKQNMEEIQADILLTEKDRNSLTNKRR